MTTDYSRKNPAIFPNRREIIIKLKKKMKFWSCMPIKSNMLTKK